MPPGGPRIHSELRLLGHDLAESTVAKYMIRHNKPPSPTWKTFLTSHVGELAAIDFFTVPTATFRVLYVFVVLSVDRRRVLHFGVTANPSAQWTAQQIVEAFPYDTAPRYLQRDRDGIYSQFPPADQEPGHRRGGQRTAFALAESVCRAADRVDPPRVLGSHDHRE